MVQQTPAPTVSNIDTSMVQNRDAIMSECLHGSDDQIAVACSQKVLKDQCVGAMYDWWCNVNKPCNCEEPVCTTDANTEVTTCADPVCSKTTDEECRIINRNAADGLHSAKCCNWNATGGPDINGDGTPDGFCWFDNSTVE